VILGTHKYRQRKPKKNTRKMVKICENQVHQLPRTPLNSADPRWITAAIPTIPIVQELDSPSKALVGGYRQAAVL
jgi:hypothetical protein